MKISYVLIAIVYHTVLLTVAARGHTKKYLFKMILRGHIMILCGHKMILCGHTIIHKCEYLPKQKYYVATPYYVDT